MKKVLLVFTLVFIITALFAGCGTSGTTPGTSGQDSSGSKEEVTIKFWKAPHISDEEATWKEITEKFQKNYPNVKFDYLATPWDTWDEQYTAAFAGNAPPDVSYMTEHYPPFAKNNKLADLTPYVTEEYRKEFLPASFTYATFGGKLYGIPYDMSTSGFMYNKDLLEKEGVALPDTWDEFVEACIKLTKDTDGDGKTDQWGIGFEMTPVQSMDFLTFNDFIMAAGASIYNEDGTKMNFNNEKGLKGVQFVLDLFYKYKVTPPIDMFTIEQVRDEIYKGKIAFYPNQSWLYGELKKNAPDINWGFARMPAGPSEDESLRRANYGGEGMFSMSQACKNKDIAWKFIEFLNEPEIQAIYMGKAGWMSARYKTNDLMKETNEMIKDIEVSMNDSYFYPADLKFFKFGEGMKTMWEEIIRQAKTPEQAIADYIKAYDEYNP